jgi:Protein of unknown function (DUF2934)
MQDLEQAIRERAYDLWIADGCRDGFAHTHWLAAQREVLASSLAGIARVTLADSQAKSVASDKKPQKGKAASRAKGRRRAA